MSARAQRRYVAQPTALVSERNDDVERDGYRDFREPWSVFDRQTSTAVFECSTVRAARQRADELEAEDKKNREALL